MVGYGTYPTSIPPCHILLTCIVYSTTSFPSKGPPRHKVPPKKRRTLTQAEKRHNESDKQKAEMLELFKSTFQM
jgi:hypothetical protein